VTSYPIKLNTLFEENKRRGNLLSLIVMMRAFSGGFQNRFTTNLGQGDCFGDDTTMG
jgi:hypothetical protein